MVVVFSRRLFGATALLAGAVIATAQAQGARGAGPFGGRLAAAVFSASPKHSLTAADAARVAPPLRTRFERFQKCHAAFRSRLPEPKDFFAEAALSKERAVERAIGCVIEAPGIGQLATRYAREARILYEWEGISSSPLEEADYAARYIDEHPDSVLKPYLYLFIAQRLRYAFEFLMGEKDRSEATAVAARYRAYIGHARQADPLTALIADDLDGLPFVSHEVGRHPRDY